MTSFPVTSFPVSARWLSEGFREAGFDGNVEMRPAFDRRDQGEGIGSLTLTFWLRGPGGAVAWELLTGCYLRQRERGNPTPGSVDWHSPAALYEGQEPQLDCRLLGLGTPCYADSGYLLGDQAYAALVSGGEEALWLFLRQQYDDRFDAGAV